MQVATALPDFSLFGIKMKKLVLGIALALWAIPSFGQSLTPAPAIPQYWVPSTGGSFIGFSAGNVASTGVGNTAFGYQSGSSLTVQNGSISPAVLANTFMGYQAGAATTSGDSNVFMGYKAGALNTCGRSSVAIGSYAFSSYVSEPGCPPVENGLNVMIGAAAGQNMTSGGHNVFIGEDTGLQFISGGNTTLIGSHAGTGLTTTGGDSTYIGASAGNNATTTGAQNTVVGGTAADYLSGTAASNVIIGYAAAQASALNPNTASLNVIIGAQSGSVITSGAQHVLIGYQAGSSMTTASANVFIGYQAGMNTTTGGPSNVFIGNGAGSANITGARNIYLGAGAGNTAPTSSQNLFVAGGSGASRIDNVYFGKGYADTSATGYTIHGTGGSGTDNVGGSVTVASGLSTGAGTNPDLIFQTGVKIASGTGFGTATTGLLIKGETQQVQLPRITSDAALTDTTVCQDTTNHTLFSGSGALGVCLGTSGRQFKTDFAPMQAGLAEIMKINLWNYRYKLGYGDNGARIQYGPTAQDVEMVLPDLAGHDEKGNTINYDWGALIPIALKAIQELKADNDNLRSEVKKLSSR